MQDYINTQGRRRAEANIEMLTSLMENPPKDLKDTIDFFYQIKSGPGLTDADFKSTNKGLSGIFKDFSKKE